MKRMIDTLSDLNDRQVLAVLFGVAILTSIVSALLNLIHDVSPAPEWWVGWFQNFSTEMMGAFLTFVLLNMLVGNRQEKGRLMRQMRSKDNALALQAVAELGAHGWLSDGSLVGASLIRANLEGLRLWDTNLQKADLHGVQLSNAMLERVNFTGANLWNANMVGATLQHVNLEGTDLYHADMRQVKLIAVEFDEETRLPDGTRWTRDTDLSRFTDPDHEFFWQPPWYHDQDTSEMPLTGN